MCKTIKGSTEPPLEISNRPVAAMQPFHMISQHKPRMEVLAVARHSPYTPWCFCCYLVARMAMMALDVDGAKSWLGFDTAFVLLLCTSLWTHLRQPHVVVI